MRTSYQKLEMLGWEACLIELMVQLHLPKLLQMTSSLILCKWQLLGWHQQRNACRKPLLVVQTEFFFFFDLSYPIKLETLVEVLHSIKAWWFHGLSCLSVPCLLCRVKELGRFSVESDVYSFGVFLLELVSGREAKSDPSIIEWVYANLVKK